MSRPLAAQSATTTVPGLFDSIDKAFLNALRGVTVIANLFPGADIGEQINNAGASLPNGGTILVLNGDYVQTTRVVVADNCKVLVGNGTISNSFSPGLPPWLLKDNASLVGSGWGAKIMGPICSTGASIIVSDYVSGTDNSLVGNSNLLVKDIQFIPNPASTSLAESASVQFGNVRNARVEHCFFNGVEGYGAFQASSSIRGFHGDGFAIVDCVFENISTQQAGVINCANWWIEGNLFRPTTITSNYTVVDCESNTGADILRDFHIVNNIFDFNSSAIYNPGAMIQVIGGSATPFKPFAGRASYGNISGNQCISGDSSLSSPSWASFSNGIRLVHCDHVTVSHNNVAYCSWPIGLEDCRSCIVDHNITQGGQQNESDHINLFDCFDCVVRANKCVEHNGGAWSTPNISEGGTSDRNIFEGNWCEFYPDATLADTGNRDCKINLVGQHSRVWNSRLGHTTPTPVDAALITTIAELRNVPEPGTRHASAPPVVLVGGYAAQADGNLSAWYYDYTYAGADNGITAVISTYRIAATGAWRRANAQITLTATQRDALSLGAGDAGFEIYNSTLNKKQCWDGSAWQSYW